jgi:hypothetical protein
MVKRKITKNTTCSRTDITVKNCSFGGKQQAFTHLVVNNRHSLIWWQTTGIHSFGGKQQAFTHLVVNNRHSLAASTSFVVIGGSRTEIELANYHTRGENTNY